MAFVLSFLLQLATLAPCLAPSSIYLPQLVFYGWGYPYLIAAALSGSCLFLGGVRAAHCVAGSRRWSMPLVSGLLILLCLTLLAAGAFYAKFGTYPSPVIALDLVAAPSAFLAYTRSDLSLSDSLVLTTIAVFMIGAGVAITSRVWRERVAPLRPAWNILLGSALLVGLHDFPPQSVSREHGFLLSEHSLPTVKYALELFTPFDSNRIDVARPYIPRPSSKPETVPVPQARHVLLIIAECLRADHLPAYGYSRNTTPFIQSEGGRWLTFQRVYAHGSRTADSLPVLFNSQYFAAIDRRNDGASTLWRFLRHRGIGSAFLSAGTMEWGGVTHSLDLRDVDYQLIASKVDLAQRRELTGIQFDYAVDDSIPLRRYVGLLEKEFAGRPSFVSVHLVGSHFPFQYEGTPDTFLPSLRQPGSASTGPDDPARRLQSYGGKTNVTESAIRRISNSYDNSIVHIDRLVQQAVEALERAGIADDSVIIVTSDHGESLGEHQTFFHGTTLYEEQVHVPLLIRVGAHLAPVRSLLAPRLPHVAGQVDLMPTILHLLAGTSPPLDPFEGVSWLSSYRKPYELLLFRGIGERLAIVTDDMKYVFDLRGQLAEQFSLAADPSERRNLWKGDESHASQFVMTLVNNRVLHQPQVFPIPNP